MCGYGEVYGGDPVWVCTGWKERIGKKEMGSETGGGARFETRGIPSSRRKNDGMCSRGVGVLVSSALRGVLVPGCRDDNWRMPAAAAKARCCLYSGGSERLQMLVMPARRVWRTARALSLLM